MSSDPEQYTEADPLLGKKKPRTSFLGIIRDPRSYRPRESAQETPEQKKDRIKKAVRVLLNQLPPDFLGADNYGQKVVDLENNHLPDVETLSEADIKEILEMEVGTKLGGNKGPAYLYIASAVREEKHPRTMKVVAEIGLRRLQRGRSGQVVSQRQMPNRVLFYGIDKLLNDPKLSRYAKSKLNKPDNRLVNLVLHRISEALLSRHNDEDYKRQLWQRLNKFTPAVIQRCLEKTWSDGTNLFAVVRDNPAIISAYPNVITAFNNLKIKEFNNALDSKKVSNFAKELQKVQGTGTEVEQLQLLINKLVDLIGTSRFHGKHEDMMELCLIRLAQLSDFREGLKLDPEVLKKCLSIVDRYILPKNRRKFFATEFSSGRTMRAYVRRVVPSFQEYKNLPVFSPRVNIAVVVKHSGNDIIAKVKSGELDIQDLLLQIVERDYFYEGVARSFVDEGADMDREDATGSSFFKVALDKLGKAASDNRGELAWEFYIQDKIEKGVNLNVVLSKVVDTYIECSVAYGRFAKKGERGVFSGLLDTMNGCREAVVELGARNVFVTQEILDKLEAANDMDPAYKAKLQSKLSELLVAAPEASTSGSSNVGNNNNSGARLGMEAVRMDGSNKEVKKVNKDKEDLVELAEPPKSVAAPTLTPAAVVAATPVVLPVVAAVSPVAINLGDFYNVLLFGLYSTDINPLIHALDSQVQELSDTYKIMLCGFELSDDTKVLLLANGFAKFLTSENEALGIEQRAKSLQKLQGFLSLDGAFVHGGFISLLKRIGSDIQKLSPSEVRELCRVKFDPKEQAFLSKNIDYFDHFQMLVNMGKSFLENLKAMLADDCVVCDLRCKSAEKLMLALNETEQEEFRAYLLSEEGAGIVQNFWMNAIYAGQSAVLGVLIDRGVKDINAMIVYAEKLNTAQMTAFLKQRQQALAPTSPRRMASQEEIVSAVAVHGLTPSPKAERKAEVATEVVGATSQGSVVPGNN